MALPPGFDPNKMTFGRSAPKIDIPRNYSTSTTTSSGSWGGSRVPLWSRYNKGVVNFGDWIADHVETVQDINSAILFLGYVGLLIYFFVKAWMEGGFLSALLSGLLAGVVGYFATGLAILVVNFVINVVMYCFRFIFWNGWTLLLAVMAGCVLL